MATRLHICSPSFLQRGSALIVSLLILLVLTVIGVTSMSTTALQSKMASNSREYNQGFQATESALRYGEAEISGVPAPAGYDAACTNGLCLPPLSGAPLWPTIVWTAGARTYGTSTATALEGIPAALQPKYVIEKLPRTPIRGFPINNPPQQYRITASGTGANGTAAVMLQSIYRP
ncbi:MAG: pilus assembly PilX family protein [Gammaproteobacteria bacterium]